MKKQTGIIIAVIIVIIILGVILLKKPATTSNTVAPVSDSTATVDTGTATTTTTMTSTATAPQVKSFTVTGSNFAFDPKTITVNKGDTVKIIFVNSGGLHDFKIDEFNVSTERLESGDQTTVQFVADKAGTFQYYCSVGAHRTMGMWGTLTVL